MDIVFIKGLKVNTTIGIFAWEKKIKQNLSIDLEIATDAKAAAVGDNIADAVDYKAISHYVKDFVESSQYQLVETLAEAIATELLREFSLSWIKLCIAKPFAVTHAKEVGIIIERGNQ